MMGNEMQYSHAVQSGNGAETMASNFTAKGGDAASWCGVPVSMDLAAAREGQVRTVYVQAVQWVGGRVFVCPRGALY